MNRSPGRDLLVGLFVLAGLAAIAYLSFAVGGLSFNETGGLVLSADFDEIAGLKPRSQVVISGVKVGQVTSITLAGDDRARVTIDVDATLKLPSDTSASIVTAGLLGDRYISLQPGGDETLLKPGDTITFTESAVILERLIGKFVHNSDVGKAE
ncbi:MAG TPA: outer membrane lipid asymmetry maintenance protein MlaD [Candidatus Binatia bacterium]|nr:outer membrane lipid asymmetry maintenance protein MlaD [Candidatus Binatia bacterium]